MTGTTLKRKSRIENKKKKMAALLDIVKLNEHDRALKNKHAAKLDADETTLNVNPGAEPDPKRIKTDIEPIILSNNDQNIDPAPVIGPSGKEQLTGDEFVQLKKMLREKTKKIRAVPKFRLRELGENATLNINLIDRTPMFLSDLQHLLLYTQLGPHSPYSPARWCALEKYNNLVCTNLLIIENVSMYHFMAHESQFPFLSTMFQNKLEMITPASYHSDIVRDLSMVPLTGSQMKRFINQYGDLETAVIESNEVFDSVKKFFPIEETHDNKHSDPNLPETDKFPRTRLVLSGWQMVEENFPLPIKGLMERKYPGYRLTKSVYKNVTPRSPLYAIDCEMCRTSTGELELTRISAVNEDLEVFYDTLVKPDNKIVDYLTRFSGINAKLMKNVTKKLNEVQDDLVRLLPSDAILVGQSLGNDLHALKMMHPYIIDTSVIFNTTGDRTRKTKLQTLAREFLSEKIQTGTQGHCSTEDSLACMKLVQLRLSKHLYFGDAVMGGYNNDMRTYPDMGTANFATSMLRQCTKMDKSALVVGVDDLGNKYKFYADKGNLNSTKANIEFLSEKSNKEVIKKFCKVLGEYHLNMAHIRILDNQIDGVKCKIFGAVDKWVRDIYDETPGHSLNIVLFGGQKQSNGVCFLQLKNE